MKYIDVSKFKRKDNLILNGVDLFLVVKSQNQIERKKRMIESKKSNRYGRFTPFPTAIGLLVKGRLKNNIVQVEWQKEFREPRHIKKLSNGNFTLTEINRLSIINPKGELIRSYKNSFFAYLHTIDISRDEKRALIVSSGYDAIIEIYLETGKETFIWFAWDHGFNPSEDGTWYTVDEVKYITYLNDKKKAVLIDPFKYGEQGVTTANRVAHPNAAIYDYSVMNPSCIVSIGHNGLLSRIDLSDGSIEHLYNKLTVMAHGIFPFNDSGLMITQTTKGEWLWLNKNYKEERIFDFKKIEDKMPGSEDSEWIQQVVPIGKSKALAIDANRGLIALDFEKEIYSVYHPNENWCIQDSLIL